MNSNEIWTIGHSNKPLEVFLTLLRSQRIEVLADVRRFPGSRRYPHFNSEQLSTALGEVEIEYAHFPELGGRRPAQKNSPNDAWRNDAFRGYADYMMTGEFGAGIDRLLQSATKKRAVIMCAEVLWWQCHRSLIADFLKAREWQVWHILSESKVEEHPYTSAARIVNGQLNYSAPSAPLEFKFDEPR